MADLVVVVPGIIGSTLAKSDGSLRSTLWRVLNRKVLASFGLLALNKKLLTLPPGIADGPCPEGIVSTGLLPDLHSIPHLWTIDGYNQLCDHIADTFDLREPTTELPGNFIKFHYDWRLSNRFNGRRMHSEVLHELSRWRNHTDNPDAELVIICHSMGGLLTRWFLDVEGGSTECRKLITIGTPYQGAPKAIGSVVNGVHVGVGKIGLDLTALVRSLPSVHQLLPVYPSVGAPGRVLQTPSESPVDLLQSDMALDAAEFHRELAEGALSTTGSYRIFALKGQFQPTDQVARLDDGVLTLDDLQDEGEQGAVTYLKPDRETGVPQPMINAQGDGTVPRASSHPPEWASEEDIDAGALVQGFTSGHAHVQNHDALFDSIDQILTADQLGLTAGGGSYGLSGPETIMQGELYEFRAVGDALKRNPRLLAMVDGDESDPIELENLGGGNYLGRIDDLPEDAHTITVYTSGFRNRVDTIDHIVTVIPVTGIEVAAPA